MTAYSGRPRSGSKTDHNIAGLYDLERTLGSGHFAVVKLARHVFTGESVAVKVIDKTKLDDIARAHLYQEVRCMKLVQHPNVVRLYEVIDTQTKLYLILEFGDGGDMYDYIMKHEGQGISEDKARHYFKQIVSAIDYCHRLHVVHRDLKPENVIFFKSQDVAKLTDFGFSNSFLPGEKLVTSCGSLAYSAPEILLGDSYDAPAVDVWSLGVILYMMVCGAGPFSHSNDSETLTMIMDCKYYLPEHLSDDLKNLISKMLVREPQSRIALDKIADDPWLKVGELTMMTTPLISELNISKDIHMVVIRRMEDGQIATKSDIKKSLENNKYDHITATYFLLAERFLKRRYGSSAVHVKLEERHAYPYDDIYTGSDTNLELTAEAGLSYSLGTDLEKSDYGNRTDVGQENRVSYVTETSPLALAGQVRHSRPAYTSGLFKKTLSSPNILNEISEECESEADESPMSSPKARHVSHRRRKFDSKRSHGGCKLSPIHSRRSSYSSSDDDDSHSLRTSQSAISSIIGNGKPLGNVAEDKKEKQVPHCDETGKQHTFVAEIVTKLYTDPAFVTSDDEKQNKENDSNFMNTLGVQYPSGQKQPLRHLSDTNLYILYGYNVDCGRKYLSDTNLQVLNMNIKNAQYSGFNYNGKIGEGLTIYSQFSPPTDFVVNGTQNDTERKPVICTIEEHVPAETNREQFSDITEMHDSDALKTGKCVKAIRRESVQSSVGSQRESKSSLKYVYNESNNNADRTVIAIEDTTNGKVEQSAEMKSVSEKNPHGAPVSSYVFPGRTVTFVESACCIIV